MFMKKQKVIAKITVDLKKIKNGKQDFIVKDLTNPNNIVVLKAERKSVGVYTIKGAIFEKPKLN